MADAQLINNVIIDTDVGVDDTFCMANFLTLHRKKRCKVLGITTVCGNITTENAFQSACILVRDVLKVTDVPVFRSGCSEFNDCNCSFFYGQDGHCGTLKKQSNRLFSTPNQTSEQFLIEQLKTEQNVTVVAIGPLTNLAKAELLCPGVLKKCKEIIVMGGTVYEPGNCPKTKMESEYNFGMDGKAAKCVVSSGVNLTLFPLDVTSSVRFDIIELLNRSSRTKQKEFYKDCIEGTFNAMVLHGETKPEDKRLTIHDVHCFVYHMNPQLYSIEEMRISVDEEGRVTREKGESQIRPVRVALSGKDDSEITQLVLGMFE
ncbi:hypothetical protein ACHWQZ_G000837 [Mnemiopsis leidyi]